MKCPYCEDIVDGIKPDRECSTCGAFEKINDNGNPMWMRNGKILSAPVEESEAYEDALKQAESARVAINNIKSDP